MLHLHSKRFIMGKRVLAVASAGGHWQQLMLLKDGFAGHGTLFLTTLKGLPEQFDARPACILRDCNRNDLVGIGICTLQLCWHLLRFRPNAVVSTGALPGVIALALGRALGAKTVWIDSVANAEEMSMSGRLAKRFAHHWLSQWQHVAEAEGAEYEGAVL
jgi:UDP-N-acetylglucosamine:LPS N-acetylglucosamine transferase